MLNIESYHKIENFQLNSSCTREIEVNNIEDMFGTRWAHIIDK